MKNVCLYASVVVVMAVVMMASTDKTTTYATDIRTEHNSPLTPPAGNCGENRSCPIVFLLQLLSCIPGCSTVNGEHHSSTSCEEVKSTIEEVVLRARPRHCKDLLASGDTGRGVRQVYPYPGRPYDAVTVFCDQVVDGGGWTVFQHRTNATATREDFYRTWVEYQLGFGNLEGEFWLGLELMHVLTSSSLQELRVDLADFDGAQRFAKYGFFYVGPASDKYRLKIGRYSGNAGDGMANSEQHLNGKMFSTHDADHDTSDTNCASTYRGAWWYAACHRSNLNGYQYEGAHETFADGINWHPWRDYYYSLMTTSLMVRPAF